MYFTMIGYLIRVYLAWESETETLRLTKRKQESRELSRKEPPRDAG